MKNKYEILYSDNHTEIVDHETMENLIYELESYEPFEVEYSKEYDKAKSIAEKLPDMIITRDWLWPDVVTGVERIKATQEIFSNLVELFYSKLITKTYSYCPSIPWAIPF